MRRFAQLRFDRALLLGVLTFLMVDGIFFDGPGSTANVASTWFFVCIAWLAVARRSTEPRDGAPPETPELVPPVTVPPVTPLPARQYRPGLPNC
jgi:hypothetical protein